MGVVDEVAGSCGLLLVSFALKAVEYSSFLLYSTNEM